MDIGLSIMIRCLASECPRPQRAGQFDGRAMMAGTTHHKVLIVGGGTAGITVAASLKRHGPGGIDIAIVEPSDTHYYQPAFTLVGAGVYDLARTRRTTESLVPSGVKRIKAAAHKFDPANNKVELSTGDAVAYDYLVVCTGVKLDWAKIDGLAEALGREGVCSNYSPDHVRYTWECIKALKPGSKAVFTQPPLPFKCPGAPQKIVYLTADYLQRGGIRTNVDLKYFVHAPGFSACRFSPASVPRLPSATASRCTTSTTSSPLTPKPRPRSSRSSAATARASASGFLINFCKSRRRKVRPTTSVRARSPTPLAGLKSTRTRCSTCATPMCSRSATSPRRPIRRPPPPCASRRPW